MGVLLVLTTLPDQDSAAKLARQLVEARLAACVNILAPCRSVYQWRDGLQEDEEYPLLIKTTGDRYADLETLLRQQHPYELPEVVALPVDNGLPAYLDWVIDQTRAIT
jgi:periplasmic divalent cation tolerance protein